MKLKQIIFPAAIAFTMVLGGCSDKFEEYERNPNRAESVSPDLVFRGVVSDMNIDRPWSNITRWNQFDCCNYNYYGDQRYDWTGASLNYTTLKNVVKMEEEAIKRGQPEVNPYSALGKFARAFFYYRMSSLVGDLPMNEALKGLEVTTPKYDAQKDIFLQILDWLEKSNTELTQLIASGDRSLDGDIYFANDLRKWQKVVNTFRLRVLISMSRREGEAGLNLKAQFAELFNNKAKYPMMESMQDNLQYAYSQFNKYPSNPDNLGFDATRYNLSATHLDNLVTINDPRAYIVAEPATKQLNTNGKTPADITAYVGAPAGEDLANMSSKMANAEQAEYSVRSRSRYYNNYVGEPGIIIGYPEMCFNIAEAINRGWLTGDAEEWYKNGIKASWRFYGIPVEMAGSITKIYNNQSYVIPVDFEGVYYKQAAVKYSGNNTDGLKQILIQKYLAFFQNSGWEAYFNWRRTGLPDFSVGTGTGNSGAIPMRFQYPSSERTTNSANWTSALQSQYGGEDNINARMWLVK
ncbi:SusD/RagB family nutrient-binding outer membrane lipoprotein [Flavihumibacter rivuli]|uniref:SusD/RagB family nutrient-binding outer membrane lipoprotein n=1 Tax=Flavihumibacter rivuli TaxID=2838156 RepID=UPI001BDDD785|nr:SusD/RagB family nutrient-binding outer membrane lipoprotein [Flavihumibacter rivuli]ULQ57012.1 SusD/RagB family nutrient-binding outer membrane lipoprotein [Flavihumibacter rivuli]